MNLTTEQMEQILDVAPAFAKYYMHDKNLHGDIGFYSEKFVIGHHNKATSFKLTDIRAELDSRQIDSPACIDCGSTDLYSGGEIKEPKMCVDCYAAMIGFSRAGEQFVETEQLLDVCLSDSAKNDTQSDLSIKTDSQEQSVIERVKLLKKYVAELDSNNTIQSSLLSSVDWKINKLFPELKDVDHE